jgi:hypothetical protein
MNRMRLVALLVVFVLGTFFVDAPRVPVPVNCAVGPDSAERTTLGTFSAWTGPGQRSRGHAHNDYEHRRPLSDAVAAGFGSVEADVWAVDGELLVAHERDEVDPSRTLASLYLDPLAERFAGTRRTPVPRLQLLVDIKSDPSTTLPLLRDQLEDHAGLLTRYRGCTATPGPVSVVVSGKHVRPQAPAAGTTSYFGYDMQPERARDTGLRRAVTPLVSADWDAYFTWDGHGRMPVSQRARLDRMVRAAHAAGSAMRFYDTPDDRGPARTAVWRELTTADVDYISTDDLSGFRGLPRGG